MNQLVPTVVKCPGIVGQPLHIVSWLQVPVSVVEICKHTNPVLSPPIAPVSATVSIGAIAGGIVGAMLVVLLVILVIIFLAVFLR